MKCISCNNSNLVLYKNNSNLGLPVHHCEKCGLHVSGNSEKEISKKISNLYKKQFWDDRTSEKSITSKYSDVDSQGKKRNWISQYAYCKSYFINKGGVCWDRNGAEASAWRSGVVAALEGTRGQLPEEPHEHGRPGQ